MIVSTHSNHCGYLSLETLNESSNFSRSYWSLLYLIEHNFWFIYFRRKMSASMFYNSSLSFTTNNTFREHLKQYVHNVNQNLSYIQVGICIFGLLGNLLVLLVINQKSLRNTSSAVFITYLAIFDSAVLILHGINLAKPRRNLYLLCILTFFTDLSIFCANWILVIITVGKSLWSQSMENSLVLLLERCIAVYSPFMAKRFCTTHSARRSSILFLTISTIFLGINFPLLYQIKGLPVTEKCRIRREASTFIRIYQSILFIGIPDVLLLSNLFTIYTLFRRRQRLNLSYMNKGEQLEMRVNDVQYSRKQRQLTIMLVTVSLSFYLFTTPAMVVFIKEMRPSRHRNLAKHKRDFLFSQITVVLSELNNAVSSFSFE